MVTLHFHAKDLHAPGYNEVEFPGYPSICRQNTSLALSGKAYLLLEESYSSLIQFSYTDGCVKLVIFLRGNLPYNWGFPVEANQGACLLGFNHNHRITRAHQVDRLEIDETFLMQKDQIGMELDY